MGARHGSRAAFYRLRALNVNLGKSCFSPLLVLWQAEMGDPEGVPPARHPLTQGKRIHVSLLSVWKWLFRSETFILCIGQ